MNVCGQYILFGCEIVEAYVCESLWSKNTLKELGFWPFFIFCRTVGRCCLHCLGHREAPPRKKRARNMS